MLVFRQLTKFSTTPLAKKVKMSSELVSKLGDCANRLRITAIESTSEAKSGHPTSSGLF
jgi:hypothetical protein